MATSTARKLQDFGVRSLVTHSLMAATLLGAVAAGLFMSGDVGRISFVALLNFTAGLWVSQSVHAIGNPGYRGVIDVVKRNVE